MDNNVLEKIQKICNNLDTVMRPTQKMSHFTSLRVGGEINAIVYPETRSQAAKLVNAFNESNILWSPLGYGTNLLVCEGMINRVAISLRALEERLIFDGVYITVHSGYSLPRLVNAAADRGLSGIQGLGPIPGSIGGAIKMNAGAHGYEIADVIESVDLARNGNIVTLKRDEIDFGYRNSPFSSNDLVLGTTLRLTTGNSSVIKEELNSYRQHRATTQPIRDNSAGCIFKNPNTQLTTGRMIDELGLKGVSSGGASISHTHANFIVTNGSAKADDVFNLISIVRQQVLKEKNISLELEVEVWK